jgi:hypothetical protein
MGGKIFSKTVAHDFILMMCAGWPVDTGDDDGPWDDEFNVEPYPEDSETDFGTDDGSSPRDGTEGLIPMCGGLGPAANAMPGPAPARAVETSPFQPAFVEVASVGICALRGPSHSPVEPVRKVFIRTFGIEPTRASLHELRGLFPALGKSSRDERRGLGAQWDAFDRHRPEVMAGLDDPAVLYSAFGIVFHGTKKRSDQEKIADRLKQWLGH